MTSRVNCFPDNEWGFLLSQLEDLMEDLLQVDPQVVNSQTIAELMVVAIAFIGHIEAGDKRVYVRDWIRTARAYLNAMQPVTH